MLIPLGLINFVLNADTGYVFNLSHVLYEEVIATSISLSKSLYLRVTAVGASPSEFDASCFEHHLEIAQAHGLRCDHDPQALNVLDVERRRDAIKLRKNQVPALVHALEPACALGHSL